MKKIVALLIVVPLIFGLCSCEPNESGTEDNSFVESYSSMEDSETFGVPTGDQNTEAGGEQTTPTKNADLSREPSTDVGSIVSDGYIYYPNPTSGFPHGLFRKKISGGEEETLNNRYVTNIKVLGDTVYYLHINDLYRCDVDGGNDKKLYENVSGFAVAGNWIFATRTLGDSFIGLIRQELYAIRTDGSVVHRIQPEVKNDAGSSVRIYGFNRGYCYLNVTHTYYTSANGNSIQTSDAFVLLRIDYRKDTLVLEEIPRSLNGSGDQGLIDWYYAINSRPIINDHILMKSVSQMKAISLLDRSEKILYESRIDLSQVALKDYLVYIPEEASTFRDKVVFSGYDGTEKAYTLDRSKYLAEGYYVDYYLYPHQNINDNFVLILLQLQKGTVTDYYLFALDSEGQMTQIYKKTK